jgi:hypothetical protein
MVVVVVKVLVVVVVVGGKKGEGTKEGGEYRGGDEDAHDGDNDERRSIIPATNFGA